MSAAVDTTPRRGRRFRHTRSSATCRRDGVQHETNVAIITAVRQGRVYYRWYFEALDDGSIGRGSWYADIEPDANWPTLRPGFQAHVAEWVS